MRRFTLQLTQPTHLHYCPACQMSWACSDLDEHEGSVWIGPNKHPKGEGRICITCDVLHMGEADQECTCHLGRPPCWFCTRPWDCECEGNHVDGHTSGCLENGGRDD